LRSLSSGAHTRDPLADARNDEEPAYSVLLPSLREASNRNQVRRSVSSIKVSSVPGFRHYNPIGSVHGGYAATAEARITDAKGRLLAHATTTCLVFEIPGPDAKGM
jgi:hypothetical protein